MGLTPKEVHMLWSPTHRDAVIEALETALEIRVAVGNTSGGPVLECLSARARSGVPVLVVTGCGGGSTRREAVERLRASGAKALVVDDLSGGRFHAKVYAYRAPDGSVRAFVGSANLSAAAFGANDELLVAVPLQESQWYELGERLHEAGPLLDLKDLPLPPDTTAPPRRRADPIAVEDVLQMDWPEYVQALRDMDAWWGQQGMRVFGESRGWAYTIERLRWFTAGPIQRLSPLERRILVGKAAVGDVAYFGDFMGTPAKAAVLSPEKPEWQHACKLIDTARDTMAHAGAPVAPDVAVATMETLFAVPGIWLGVASRLLLSVRPDVFVAVNRGSRARLESAFSLKLPTQKPPSRRCGDYTRLLERVHQAPWYTAPRPSDPLGQTVWDARAAFLDVFVYDPEPR